MEFANAVPAVIKQQSNLSFVGIDSADECVYTTAVQDPMWKHADEIRFCPVMLQERIDKVFDIRITVVGSKRGGWPNSDRSISGISA
jgi:hypothetical protein